MIGEEKNMKEATGEGAMTVITISLISLALALGVIIIATALNNQRKRTNCENAGYYYENGACHKDNGDICNLNSDGECE